jgi:hypothetical protein
VLLVALATFRLRNNSGQCHLEQQIKTKTNKTKQNKTNNKKPKKI